MNRSAGQGWAARRLEVVAVAALAMSIAAACGQTSPAPGTPTAAAATPGPTATQAALEPTQPPTQAACISVADLADRGEPVEIAMTSLKTALQAEKADDARAAAASAADGMRSLASFVGAASPDAKAQFLAAADELDQAKAQFPAGASLADQAKEDLEKAFMTARAAACAG